MKRAGVIAASLALAGSAVIATPSFGAKRPSNDPACARLEKEVDQLRLRLARQGVDSRAGARTLGKILAAQETARFLHCGRL